MPEHTYLVLANEELGVHPRVVLVEELRTVPSLAQEDLPAAWVHLGVLRHIVYSSIKGSPAVFFSLV